MTDKKNNRHYVYQLNVCYVYAAHIEHFKRKIKSKSNDKWKEKKHIEFWNSRKNIKSNGVTSDFPSVCVINFAANVLLATNIYYKQREEEKTNRKKQQYHFEKQIRRQKKFDKMTTTPTKSNCVHSGRTYNKSNNQHK